MRSRAAALPVVILLVAACAEAPEGSGAGDTASPSPNGSASPSGALLLEGYEGPVVVPLDPSMPSVPLGSDLGSSDASADGTTVLATVRETGVSGRPVWRELVSIDVATLERTVLARPAPHEVISLAAWSPDDARVAFRLTTYSVPAEEAYARHVESEVLCVLDVSKLGASAPRCFPGAGTAYSFDWAPDSSSLVLGGPGWEPIAVVDVSTGETRTVMPAGGTASVQEAVEAAGWGGVTQFVGPDWSPNGRSIAALAMLENEVHSVSIAFDLTGQLVGLGRPSADFTEAMGWSPMGDVFAYGVADRAAHLWIDELRLLDVERGTDQLLAGPEGEPGSRSIVDLAWSSNGEWIATLDWVREGGYSSRNELRILDRAGAVDSRHATTAEALVDWMPWPPGP